MQGSSIHLISCYDFYMKILHVVPQLKHGGVETAVFNSIERIRKSGYDFNVLTIERGKCFNNSYVKVEHCLNSSVYNPVCFYKFIRFIHKEKPDLIVYSLWKSALLGISLCLLKPFLKSKPKTALIIHNTRFAHFVDYIITKLSLKITDSIYFDSEKSKAYFLNRDYATGEVISFIDKKMVAKKFNNINGEIKFVFIGRLHSQKGVDRALKYIHLFKKQHEEIRFDIYGPDEGELNNIINKVNKLGLQDKVVYKGVVDNNKVNDILTQYDFYLQFSHFEGMAMSVVDAMQVGVIPIVNNVGEIPNYVKNNINGIILDDKKLGDENYLNLNISCLLNIIKNDGGYFLYNNAIKTFQDNNTYVDDYIKKIINANN